MLDNDDEYEAMREAEEGLWWYKNLRRLVAHEVQRAFADRRDDVRILDAGCGTGGTLRHLRGCGYSCIEGFDLSERALELAASGGLKVRKLDLLDAPSTYAQAAFDVIVINDVMCFVPQEQWSELLRGYGRLLRKDGILILNLTAGREFAGIHDLVLSIPARADAKEFRGVAKAAGLSVLREKRWPQLLAPAIWSVRFLQRQRIKAGVDKSKLHSDVHPIHPIANAVFYGLTRLEDTIVPWPVWGSSAFFVLTRHDA
jgi:SAM-dependent methyltransferase